MLLELQTGLKERIRIVVSGLRLDYRSATPDKHTVRPINEAHCSVNQIARSSE